LSLAYIAKLWLSAAVSAGLGWAIKLAIGNRHPVIVAVLVLLPYGLSYFAITSALGVPAARVVVERAARIVGRRKK
jgi:putative peptidoglycan lipid II flippase